MRSRLFNYRVRCCLRQLFLGFQLHSFIGFRVAGWRLGCDQETENMNNLENFKSEFWKFPFSSFKFQYLNSLNRLWRGCETFRYVRVQKMFISLSLSVSQLLCHCDFTEIKFSSAVWCVVLLPVFRVFQSAAIWTTKIVSWKLTGSRSSVAVCTLPVFAELVRCAHFSRRFVG